LNLSNISLKKANQYISSSVHRAEIPYIDRNMGLFNHLALSDTPKEVFNYHLFWSVGVFGVLSFPKSSCWRLTELRQVFSAQAEELTKA
jgi:hypothetical protein